MILTKFRTYQVRVRKRLFVASVSPVTLVFLCLEDSLNVQRRIIAHDAARSEDLLRIFAVFLATFRLLTGAKLGKRAIDSMLRVSRRSSYGHAGAFPAVLA